MQMRQMAHDVRVPMTEREEDMPTERLMQICAEDWELLLAIKERLPRRVVLMRRRGVPGQHIARETRIPETNIRRWFNGSSVGAA